MLENKTKMKPGTRFVVYYVGGLFLVSVVVFINLLTSTSSEGRCIDYCTGLELNVIRYLAFWFFLFPPLYGLITLIRAYRKDRNNFLIKSKLFFKNPLVILLIFLVAAWLIYSYIDLKPKKTTLPEQIPADNEVQNVPPVNLPNF